MAGDASSGERGAESLEIEPEIVRFERFPEAMARRGGPLTVKVLAPYAYSVSPTAGPRYRPDGKRFALTLIGLTHGNEWAGGGVINGVLDLLASGAVPLDVEIAVILGNPWAARQNKRFLERDLNRSFAAPLPRGQPTGSKEGDRARELEAILADTALLVDFHQVTRPIDRPFFIFPYRPESYAFARAVAPWQTIVTHWSGSFSVEGKCTDEFVNASGGIGISLELGQNGLDRRQVGTGVVSALWALTYATRRLAQQELGLALARERAQSHPPELYTWAAVMPWPEAGVVTLEPGWDNFAAVVEGQRLGAVDGKALLAPKAGRMLFPKYLTPEQQQALTSRPTELCRIMRRIDESALPSAPITPYKG